MSDKTHEGHRGRLKKRFLEEGIDGFQEHEVIELLLFYALPYQNTNGIAHRLMEEFGSLAGVVDAPFEQLTKVSGVGDHAATLLKLVAGLSRRYGVSRTAGEHIITTPEDAGSYLLPWFLGRTSEMAILLCLDAKGKVLGIERISEGGINATILDVRKVVSAAIKFSASAVVLAHNHTSGVAVPSREDVEVTKKVRTALQALDVVLLDHLVIAEGDFVSMAESGLLREQQGSGAGKGSE